MIAWLSEVRNRLASAGFVISEDVVFEDTTFPVVARRSRFELTKFGFSESFFIFAEFEWLDRNTLRDFSADAFRCAKRRKKIFLPCGLFESVWCYAVAISPDIDKETLDSVRNDTPPKHWAAAEIPVVYDVARKQLHYFEKTPLWGAAYYKGFRKQIVQFLG